MSAPVWDKMEFTYQSVEDNKDISLPLRLLILGDFSGRYKEEVVEPQSIDLKSFSNVMRAMKIGISFEVAVDLDERSVQFIDIDFSVHSIRDFEPEQVVLKIDYLKAHLELIELFKTIKVGEIPLEYNFEPIHEQILEHCGVSKSSLTDSELPFVLFDITEHLHEMLSHVLHHEEFKKQETIWRNLHALLSGIDSSQNCNVELLDVSKELLDEDFAANRDIQETSLYDVVYLKEFAQYGGQPYSAIIADYYFGTGAQDLDLLKKIAQVCSYAHAPFIAGASPNIFAEESFSALENFSDLHEYFNSPKFIKWRSFQEDFTSSYIGLTLPRIQLRPAYSLSSGEIGNLPYSEKDINQKNEVLYGNGAFAFAICLVNSFAKYAVCSDLSGTEGGSVDIYDSNNDGAIYPNYTIEALFTEQQLMQLSSLGFLTLAFNKSNQQMFFTSSGSVRWGRFANPTIPKDINSQVEAQLPYMFIVSRIIHYLKVVQRDSIGAHKSLIQVQSELNKWLKRYVSDVENPADAIRARKPLKRADVILSAPNERGEQSLDLTIVPHLRYLGKDFTLSLSVSVD